MGKLSEGIVFGVLFEAIAIVLIALGLAIALYVRQRHADHMPVSQPEQREQY
jgi:hypothetical protein